MQNPWFVRFMSYGLGVAGVTAADLGQSPGSERPTVDSLPAPQQFHQELATPFTPKHGLPAASVQLIELDHEGVPRVFCGGQWGTLRDGRWQSMPAGTPRSPAEFILADASGKPATVPLPWREVKQILRHEGKIWLTTVREPYQFVEGRLQALGWPGQQRIHQLAISAEGALVIAHSGGLSRRAGNDWVPVEITDPQGRSWQGQEILGVAYDAQGRLWVASKAGVACARAKERRSYEGKDGLPGNEFTSIAAAPNGGLWFGTQRGAIRFDGRKWDYRQGPRWLPHDEVRQIAVDARGNAWLATAGGVGFLERRPMTLAEKAAHYEAEIAQYIKRTPFGYVAEAQLQRPGERASANPQDSDNDGLWTAMYGAGECFAYGATGDPQARRRARQAFEALRFLQTVTQGGSPAPPKGFVARTIRPVEWPDPNAGRLARDREAQRHDRLWKVYEPRWPKSADGRWYWKSDTSSDELDGHYFFYPLYFDLCAETENEKERVREVVRDLTDHLLAHDFMLVDHDGRPTRWAIYSPDRLNRDPDWWGERGLNSLSILSYLAVASHVTGHPKYQEAARALIDRHGYAQNAMYPKVQHGPGSGNQSDDEMAFMCYYTLLRYSPDEALKAQMRYSFFRYWANEQPEMNPFFNFAYAAHNRGVTATNAFDQFTLQPWSGWLDDALATLRGLPLDRLNWPLQNSHRLDVARLPRQQAVDLYAADRNPRGHGHHGQVLPVENRHFNHWNTDPWALDYGGQGDELAAGTVFLLPYYLGLYHGFIAKP